MISITKKATLTWIGKMKTDHEHRKVTKALITNQFLEINCELHLLESLVAPTRLISFLCRERERREEYVRVESTGNYFPCVSI